MFFHFCLYLSVFVNRNWWKGDEVCNYNQNHSIILNSKIKGIIFGSSRYDSWPFYYFSMFCLLQIFVCVFLSRNFLDVVFLFLKTSAFVIMSDGLCIIRFWVLLLMFVSWNYRLKINSSFRLFHRSIIMHLNNI